MRTGRRGSLYAMALLYVAAGVNHFVNPAFYLPLMPSYLPWHEELVLLSGGIEVVLGVALLVPAVRRWAAWGIVALLIAVFPANLHMAIHDVYGAGVASWLRLPLQLPLIAWAWFHTREPSASPAPAPAAAR